MKTLRDVSNAVTKILGILAAIILFWSVPVLAEPGFDDKYQRDYNIFNPINKYRSDNPLNPVNEYDSDNPYNPVNRYDSDNPVNPINR